MRYARQMDIISAQEGRTRSRLTNDVASLNAGRLESVMNEAHYWSGYSVWKIRPPQNNIKKL